ncbi:MAG: hypothetical protein JNJ46_07515 [Myxococcales bacterium]|nr:hypothetical protein [Myxococcales bacterium]
MSAEAMRAWPLAGLSPRDQRILALTSGKLRGSRVDFSLALQALHEAVCETIPAGRIFLLASEATSPVFGSALSGVGLVEGSDAVQLVRVVAGKLQTLGRLLP